MKIKQTRRLMELRRNATGTMEDGRLYLALEQDGFNTGRTVPCPFCGKHHIHGKSLGHRSVHCRSTGDKNVVFVNGMGQEFNSDDGYVIVAAGSLSATKSLSCNQPVDFPEKTQPPVSPNKTRGRGVRKTMPLDDHIKTANDLAIGRAHLNQAFMRLQKYYPLSNNMMKIFLKFLPGTLVAAWLEVLSILDNDFFKSATDAGKFDELGFIYYSLDARYKSLVEKGLISRELIDPDRWGHLYKSERVSATNKAENNE